MKRTDASKLIQQRISGHFGSLKANLTEQN